MHSFHEDIVMISGGSKGIGYAIAKRLGEQGAKISFCARNENDLNQAEPELKQAGIDVLAIQADVSQEIDVNRWFQKTEKRFGLPTILVNNAGISGTNSLLELTEEQWDKTMSVNCRGVFLCTKRALPAMMQAKKGRIFMISSIASIYYRKGHSLYFASKWALRGFSHCLAKEIHEYNIHVHQICPGMTETRFFDNRGGRPHPPEKMYADPETYAEQVEYLCNMPDHLDTLEYCTFPDWQLKNFGIRR